MTAPAVVNPGYARRIASGDFAEQPFRFRRAVRGFDPGEVLTPADRRWLIRLLVQHWGWSDQQVSAHTGWTLYTVARLRDDLFLDPNAGTAPFTPDWNC